MKLELWKRPDCYVGASWDGWLVGFAKHRDSDYITRSNFSVFWEKITKSGNRLSILHPNFSYDNGPIEIDSVTIVRERHWFVGWIEWIAIHPSDTSAVAIAEELLAKLDAYPVLDDEAAENLEWREIAKYWQDSSLKDRIQLAHDANISIFSARCDEVPYDVFNNLKDSWQ